jgi:hypothetical protein
MTLRQHVYAIANLLSQGPVSDDFSYSDRLIAHFLQVARARLLEQKADKYHYISEQSYQSLCLDLQLSSFHNCCDTAANDCKVLKSVTTVPKFLNSRWGNFLKVMDLSGEVIPEFGNTQSKYSVYALVTPTTGWFMHDNYLYVLNNKHLSKILLNALFDDPNEIHQFNCPTSGETCTEFMSEEFPIDSDLIDPMYRLTLEFLLQSRGLPIDTENNAKDVETRQAVQ